MHHHSFVDYRYQSFSIGSGLEGWGGWLDALTNSGLISGEIPACKKLFFDNSLGIYGGLPGKDRCEMTRHRSRIRAFDEKGIAAF